MNLRKLDDVVANLSWAGLLYLESLVAYELESRRDFMHLVGDSS